ncbi:MAG: fatty acid desaturase [Actinobacteria bacterium]|nr:fatty acid desaturase [Actinomycetota bacterium]
MRALIPSLEERPQVFPATSFLANGVLIPQERSDLRKISDWRNVWSVCVLWIFSVGIIVEGVASHRWLAVLLAFLLMGPIHVRFAILMHEAAHRLLFSRKGVNDFAGTWLIASPAFVPLSVYRRGHMAHHREEFGPHEPDIAFYSGYPSRPRDLGRRLFRDAIGISGYKNLRTLVQAAFKASSRNIALPIIGVQLTLFAGLWLASGAWWAYPLLWLAPWMTQWRVLNRLRAIAEHGGMGASDDRRATTHHVTQHWLARAWFVPYCTGWHLAHHVDTAIPWRNLPKFNDRLEAAGYITPAITFKNYPALWRALTAER